MKDFYDFDLSMRYGVLENFFDSVGIEIQMQLDGKWWDIFINDDLVNTINAERHELNSRPEARAKAIKKANEIYNTLNK